MGSEQELIQAIESAIEERQSRREGRETKFLCPAHNDHTPSARWNHEKHVWFCDACGAGDGYLDLARRFDLLAGPERGLSVAELAQAKGLTEGFLRKLGVADGVMGQERTPCVDIPYANEDGEIVAVRKRLSLTGDGRFAWRRGDHPLPYGIAVLSEARTQANYVIIVEGESDQWVCRRADMPAIGIPGASTMKAEWGRYFEGIANIFVWHEPDTGGITFVGKVAAAVPTVRVITAPPDAKDPAELWLRCDGDVDEFQGRMSALAHAAPYASAIKADTSRQKAHEAFALASGLLGDPALLERIGGALHASGYAGDVTPPLIAYVGFSSRLLRRPLNLGYVAPSGAGKNRAIDAAMELMPASAYVLVKSGSERALIYADESYEHRILVVAEADSLPEDGPAASAIRSLATDNEMTYDTVEKNAKGQFVVRHVVKPGPTGIFTTSTRPLPHQFDTRTLTVTIADTPDQTRDVMRSHAATAQGEQEELDVRDLVALQQWLEAAGERRVVTPYAKALAEIVPANHVRMRRDFRQLITVIEAVALLYQCQRERDDRGRIIATLDDYGHARRLLLDVFQGAVTAGLTRALRETVEAVRRIYQGDPLTNQAIGDALGLSKDTTWHRVRRAITLGYLINDESRRGRPAQIRPGEPLPDDRPALPTAEELRTCVERPKSTSTIQPEGLGRWDAEVEAAVEKGAELPIQPVSARVADSPSAPDTPVVERLNLDPGEPHTAQEAEERTMVEGRFCPGASDSQALQAYAKTASVSAPPASSDRACDEESEIIVL
jgi:CHC2-type zinc finger protein